MNRTESSAPRLVQGEVGPGLLRLTTPVILGISANIVAGLIETAFLSRLGTEVITAYSFTFSISAALMSLSLGISIGVSSVLARTAGGGDKQKVKRIASDGILLIGFLTILISLIGYLSIAPLFSLWEPTTLHSRLSNSTWKSITSLYFFWRCPPWAPMLFELLGTLRFRER